MNCRRLVGVPLLALTVALAAGACSSDDGNADSSTTTTAKSSTTTSPSTSAVGNVLPPVVLTADTTSATVKPGTVVTFDVGDPGQGRFVATSEDPKVFKVESEGKVEGAATMNAGGVAVAPGTTKVTVQFMGSTNGVGTPTTFTITVE